MFAGHSFETLFDQSPHAFAHAAGTCALAGRLDGSGAAIALTLPLTTQVVVARRRDPIVHASSVNDDGPARRVFVIGEETRWNAWVDQVQGVTLALRSAGHDVLGFDLLVRSEIPPGCGLGARTALAVALVRALRDAYALDVGEDELVQIAHHAEGAFADRASIAKTTACVHATDRAALRMLAGAPEEAIALPEASEAVLLIAPAVLPVDAVAANGAAATDRAELEAARVDEIAAALRAGEPVEIGAILETVPGPESALVAATRRHPSVYGARGLAHGGAVIALVRRGQAHAVRDALSSIGGSRAVAA